MNDDFNVEIEHKNVPFVLVKFTNKSNGNVNRARFDIDKKIFIDPVPVPTDSNLRDSIVAMYKKSISSNEGLWIVNVCHLHNGWQTPVIFRKSQKLEMDKFILDEETQHNTVSINFISASEVELFRNYFTSEGK